MAVGAVPEPSPPAPEPQGDAQDQANKEPSGMRPVGNASFIGIAGEAAKELQA